MSYNIDSSEYFNGKLFIKRKDAQDLYTKFGNELPECNFLDQLELDSELDCEELLEIKEPMWYGESSGWSYHENLSEILAKTTETAVIVFIWEGGDSKTALKVENGKVTQKKVKISVED